MSRRFDAHELLFWRLGRALPTQVVVHATVAGAFDAASLQRAWARLVAARPGLRARPVVDTLLPQWEWEHAAPVPLRILERPDEQAWERVVGQELCVRHAPPVRLVALVGDGVADFILGFHHAVADARSGAFVIRDLLVELARPGSARSHAGWPSLDDRLPPAFRAELPVRVAGPEPQPDTVCWRPAAVSAQLDSARTGALRDLCRAEGCSVHALLSALMLEQVADDPFDQRPLRCSSAIDVRGMLEPAVADDFGLYVTTVTSIVRRAPRWPLARSLHADLRERIARTRLLADRRRALETALAMPLGEIANALEHYEPRHVGVSNIGAVDSGLLGSGLSFRRLGFAMAPPSCQRVLTAASVDGQLCCALVYPDVQISEHAARRQLDAVWAGIAELLAPRTSSGAVQRGRPEGRDESALRERLARLGPEQRELLLRRVRADRVQHEPAPALLPVSDNQRAMWLLAQLAPRSLAYVAPLAVRIRGPVDRVAMARAWALLASRHEALRTRIVEREGEPCQHVAPSISDAELPFGCVASEEFETAIAEAFAAPFDLARDLAWRARLISRGPSDHVLFVALHHVIVDLWSELVLMRELSACYAAALDGRLPVLPAAPAYREFVAWQRELLASPRGDELRRFWLEVLAGELPVLELPTDRPRPPTQTLRGRSLRFMLDRPRAEALRSLARRHSATEFAVVLAVYQTFLQRHTGSESVLVGFPTAGRADGRFAETVGDFVNPVVVRAEFGDDPRFVDLLARTQVRLAAALAHQDYPFSRLVEALEPTREASRSPVFQTMCVLQNQAAAVKRARADAGHARVELAFERYEVEALGAQMDLTLELMAHEDGGYEATWKYSEDLFERTTIERFVQRLLTLLDSVCADPEQRVSALAVMPVEELELTLERFNPDARELPAFASVVEMIVSVAARSPEATAVSCGAQHVSYAELLARAGALAARLVAAGVAPEEPVALLMERSLDAIVGVLAVFAANAALLPLDPTHPRERLAWILEHARVRWALASDGRAAAVVPEQVTLIPLRGEVPGHAPTTRPRASDRAYVIYTSGSTGRPKGVEVTHAALVSFLEAIRAPVGIGPDDTLAAVTTFAFDISLLELLLPLTVGARVELLAQDDCMDGERLAAVLARSRATIMQATPATWQMVLDSGELPSGLTRLCGGEALPSELAERLRADGSRVLNLYGPTEATIWSTWDDVRDADFGIGRPLANTRAYVLDERQSPVPIGVCGELYLGGAGVARGYLHDPERSAERFITDPFVVSEGGARLFRTGDRVRWRADGRLEFLGRLDAQVKIRGFRVELGEVEAALRVSDRVDEAAVVCVGSGLDKRLIAYVAGSESIDGQVLRTELSERLPAYMLPAHVFVLQRLPRTENGKLDRKALPGAPERMRAIAPPQTELEHALAGIWAKLLRGGAPGFAIGVDDNFFELGGHSLLLVQVKRAIQRELGYAVDVPALFAHPTVRALAAHIQAPVRAVDELREHASQRSTKTAGALQRMRERRAARTRTGDA